MRILLVASRSTDYLQELSYSGLAEVLGKDSVVEFPTHWQYHRTRKFFWNAPNAYPRNLGYVPGSLGGDRSLSAVKKALEAGEFDWVILGSAKPDALEALLSIAESIRAPWAFIDGGDWQEIGGDFKREGGEPCLQAFQSLCRRKKPFAIFKRELPKGQKIDGIFPLQFSFNTSRVSPLFPNAKKEYQVAFWAVESSATRKKAFEILRGKYDCDANGSVPGQKARKYALRGGSYFEALNRSRVVLSFRGVGFDTLRYWEAPASGSLLLSEMPEIEIPNDFINGKNAVLCKNDLSDLTSLIDYYLAHEKESLEIAREGQKHLLHYHTHRHRAEFILEKLKEAKKV
jgi:hypothetical protein